MHLGLENYTSLRPRQTSTQLNFIVASSYIITVSLGGTSLLSFSTQPSWRSLLAVELELVAVAKHRCRQSLLMQHWRSQMWAITWPVFHQFCGPEMFEHSELVEELVAIIGTILKHFRCSLTWYQDWWWNWKWKCCDYAIKLWPFCFKKGTSNFVRNIFRHSTNIDDQLVKIST